MGVRTWWFAAERGGDSMRPRWGAATCARRRALPVCFLISVGRPEAANEDCAVQLPESIFEGAPEREQLLGGRERGGVEAMGLGVDDTPLDHPELEPAATVCGTQRRLVDPGEAAASVADRDGPYNTVA